MKTVVCFGDSNTWGYNPEAMDRYSHTVRWTGVLQQELGGNYRVIEEGLNGRTTNLDDLIEEHRNGRRYLQPCLESHNPVDLVLVMLGTNDLKQRFNRSASDIAQSAVGLSHIARAMPVGPGGGNPVVMVIAPPPIVELTGFDDMFAGAAEKSGRFAHYFEVMAGLYRVPWFDAGAVIVSSQLDGIHFAADQHSLLGKRLALEVRSLIG